MTVSATTSMVTNTVATAYFAGRMWTANWDSADATTKDKALGHATKQINGLMFLGAQADPTQPHAFPRSYTAAPSMNAGTRYHPSGVFTEEGVPLAVQHAVCEQALFLLDQSPYERDRARQMAQGVSSISVGPASEQFSANGMEAARTGTQISPDAMRLLRGYLAVVVDLT